MIRSLAIPLILGCIWDSDTIDDELRGVPDGLTLVTGRWYRHTSAYYEKRIAELPGRLAARPDDLEAYDDLAVAWERTGHRDRAIEVMERKRQALDRHDSPEHRYRYHANLGTFLAHAGRLSEGLVEIERALALNPSAHFGREHYQVDLIRYLIAVKSAPELWKMHDALSYAGYRYRSTSRRSVTLPAYTGQSEGRLEVAWNGAYAAIGSILRYGGTEGAELYRILGDLFAENGDLNLSWWAFQHALEKKHPASEVIQTRVSEIETFWQRSGYRSIPTLELYRAARIEADRWASTFGAVEDEALIRGESPGQTEILRSITEEADRRVPRALALRSPTLTQNLGFGLVAAVSALGVGIGSGVWMSLRGRRRPGNRPRPRAARRSAISPLFRRTGGGASLP
ncbi:MAG TPA: hypothetical protein VEN81_00520 [Planctomycetota bacterium]|nr:hypothetical protein [Planctomycetota bacterium]